jgi:hypothetical protein
MPDLITVIPENSVTPDGKVISHFFPILETDVLPFHPRKSQKKKKLSSFSASGLWVPRSFLQPGLLIKLHPDDTYAYGLSRGGIDERWFGSTTVTANEGRAKDEGLSYVVVGKERFTLLDAIMACGADIIGRAIWDKYGKWPVYSKFFDNMGPIPHHMHQSAEQAALVNQEAKPESYYFPPQHNNVGNNFPYTFMGLEPGTTRQQVYDCIANWDKGYNKILELSKAYKLQPGTGWLIDPCMLRALSALTNRSGIPMFSGCIKTL